MTLTPKTKILLLILSVVATFSGWAKIAVTHPSITTALMASAPSMTQDGSQKVDSEFVPARVVNQATTARPEPIAITRSSK